MGITSNLQLGSSGDIKEAYFVENGGASVTSNYQVLVSSSIIIKADSTGGSFTITPHAEPVTDSHIRVIDVGGNASDNPITITGVGVIDTDGGVIEKKWNGASYQDYDKFEDNFDRDSSTGEMSLKESGDIQNLRAFRQPIIEATTSRTLAATDNGKAIYFTATGGKSTLTIPDSLNMTDYKVDILAFSIGHNDGLDIAVSGSATINGLTQTISINRHEMARVIQTATDSFSVIIVSGGASDIKDTYTQANNGTPITAATYTITESGSVFLEADTTSNAITITPPSSPQDGQRLKVLDVGGNAGTNIITVTGLGTIQSDGGMREWIWSDDASAWQLLDASQILFTRDASLGEVSLAGTDRLRADSIGTKAANVTLGNDGSVEATSGSFGNKAQTFTADEEADFTAEANAVWEDGSWRNARNVLATLATTATARTANWATSFGANVSALTDGSTIYSGQVHYTGVNGESIDLDNGSAQNFNQVRFYVQQSSFTNATIAIQVAPDNSGSPGAYATVQTFSNISSAQNVWFELNLDAVQNERFVRFLVSNKGTQSLFGLTEIEIRNTVFASTSNKISCNTNSGPANIAPALCTFKDENGTNITGSGVANIEHSLDNGSSYSASEDLSVFLARTELLTTTGNFIPRIELIGGQKLSEISISTQSTKNNLTGAGQNLNVNGAVVQSFDVKGNLDFIGSATELSLSSSTESWYSYTIAQDFTGGQLFDFFEHIEVTADQAFEIMFLPSNSIEDGTDFSHYASGSGGTSSAEIRSLISNAHENIGADNLSGDSITGNTDIVNGRLVSSQQDAADSNVDKVKIFIKNALFESYQLSADFSIAVNTNNNVAVAANYLDGPDSGTATQSGNQTSVVTANGLVSISSSSVAVDGSKGPVFTLTAGESFTLDNMTNVRVGKKYTLVITQDATGSRVITWGSNYKAAGGTLPTLTTTANAVDVIEFESYDGSTLVIKDVILDVS